jgi:hypothetical protein
MLKNALWVSLCVLLAAGCGTDLVPVGFEAPATAEIGEDITSSISVSVGNMGLDPAEAEECTTIFWVNFMISEDEVVDGFGLDDVLLSSVDFTDFPVVAKEDKPVVFDDETLEIPTYAPTGHVYIGVFVDAHGYCSEDDVENNVEVLPIEILDNTP